MFINKNNIFTIDGKAIAKFSYKKSLLTGKLDIFYEKNLDYKFVNKEFKKNSTIIMENEEIYIKYITIPKINKDKVERIVRDELRFYYRTDADITFSYSILKKSKTSLDLIVFYINSNILNNIDLKDTKNIKAIYLIQFCYAKYLKDISKYNKYIIAFIYNQRLYFIFCEKGLIKYNYIFRNFKESAVEFEKCLEYFVNLNKDMEDNFQMIYILGFKEETVSSIKISYCLENLGDINQNKLFKAII
ncbi:hypothetical protein [Clostridium pasteurianum]|uniref:Uncharacterized protein n=1 Tax=Clostridium pasteurianum BC1 TaxID=86416 RepID=R4KDI7_CLOPA|nr:hypothetical protein [Clostridium pasteurianum]AGK97685.1 hypothetical protein Clopa_2847 [Clostridium pasteurianum BC1]